MKPVFQKRGDGQCLNACFATLLGVSFEDAPRVRGDEDEPELMGPYLRRVRRWLSRRGCSLLGFTGKPEIYAGAAYIAIGDSPRFHRESMHAVVMVGKKVVHDPHPSGDGLLTHRYTWVVIPRFE